MPARPASAFGTLVAQYELDDPNITFDTGRVATLPNQYNPGTHDLVEAAASGPLYEAAGWNGQPSCLFDGTSDYLKADSLAAVFTGDDTPCTILVAALWNPAVGDRMWGFGSNVSAVQFFDAYTDGTNMDIQRMSTAQVNADGSTALAGREIIAMSHTGTTVSTWFNSVKDLDGAASDVPALAVDQFTFGGTRRAAGALSACANVRLSAIWIYSNALSDSAALGASAAMAKRWPPS